VMSEPAGITKMSITREGEGYYLASVVVKIGKATTRLEAKAHTYEAADEEITTLREIANNILAHKKVRKSFDALELPPRSEEDWKVEENRDGSFTVQREGHDAHRVVSVGGMESCDCKDYHFRGRVCVHILALRDWNDEMLGA